MIGLAAAEQHFAGLLTAQPDDGAALHGLGLVRRVQRRLADATALFNRAARVADDAVPSLVALAACLLDAGDAVASARAALRAVLLDPGCDGAWLHLGMALGKDCGDRGAIDALERAVACAPGNQAAWLRLAVEQRRAGVWRRCVEAAETARRLDPGADEPVAVLADVSCDHGLVADALDYYRQAVERRPDAAGPHARMLMALQYSPDADGPTLRAAHEAWARRHGDGPRPAAYDLSPEPQRRLRVGFVSGDFRVHSVSYFLLPLLDALDREKVEVLCFSTGTTRDHVTARAAATADQWFETAALDDAALTDLIGRQRVDVLVDVAGHTRGNRLGVFACAPAPVQVTWLGYPGTTGLPAMQYRIVDEVTDPPGAADVHCTETLLRLSGPFLCYEPPRSLPDLQEPPLLAADGVVTFGSFNILPKVTPQVIALWARVLLAVPRARLLLKARALEDADTAQRVAEAFARHGVAGDRLDLLGRTLTTEDHLKAYGRLDIALDTFPYNGTTTTCEALAMGVPVVTLAGADHRGRVGGSILGHSGLGAWVARDEDEYVATACALAADAEGLRALRQTVRQSLLAGPMCDARRHAEAFEGALRQVWTAWCAGTMASTCSAGEN